LLPYWTNLIINLQWHEKEHSLKIMCNKFKKSYLFVTTHLTWAINEVRRFNLFSVKFLASCVWIWNLNDRMELFLILFHVRFYGCPHKSYCFGYGWLSFYNRKKIQKYNQGVFNALIKCNKCLKINGDDIISIWKDL